MSSVSCLLPTANCQLPTVLCNFPLPFPYAIRTLVRLFLLRLLLSVAVFTATGTAIALGDTPQIDSLKTLLAGSVEDTGKVKLLNELAFRLSLIHI